MLLSIDPGLTGAWALFGASGSLLNAEELPVIRDGRLAWIDAPSLQSVLGMWIEGPVVTLIERVNPNPKNGAMTMYSQGLTLGSVLAAVQGLQSRIEFVTPGVWKSALGLTFAKDVSHGKRKQASLDKARLLYPTAKLDRVKDHNLAEAILIGHYWVNYRREVAA